MGLFDEGSLLRINNSYCKLKLRFFLLFSPFSFSFFPKKLRFLDFVNVSFSLIPITNSLFGAKTNIEHVFQFNSKNKNVRFFFLHANIHWNLEAHSNVFIECFFFFYFAQQLIRDQHGIMALLFIKRSMYSIHLQRRKMNVEKIWIRFRWREKERDRESERAREIFFPTDFSLVLWTFVKYYCVYTSSNFYKKIKFVSRFSISCLNHISSAFFATCENRN